jgi:hypothetical protein
MGGKNPLRRNLKAGHQFLNGIAGAAQGLETAIGSPVRRKALKGEAQECWELKEAFKGIGEEKR